MPHTPFRTKVNQFRDDASSHAWMRVYDTSVAVDLRSGTERVACTQCGASGTRSWWYIISPAHPDDVIRQYDPAMTAAGQCSPAAVKAFRELRRQRRSAIRWGLVFGACCALGMVWGVLRRDSWLVAWLFGMLGFMGCVVTGQTVALQHARRDGWRRERDGERDAPLFP